MKQIKIYKWVEISCMMGKRQRFDSALVSSKIISTLKKTLVGLGSSLMSDKMVKAELIDKIVEILIKDEWVSQTCTENILKFERFQITLSIESMSMTVGKLDLIAPTSFHKMCDTEMKEPEVCHIVIHLMAQR